LKVNISNVGNPRLVIYNAPQEILVEQSEETFVAQNSNLNLKLGDIKAGFKF
jgi:hypothetical protein